MPINLWHISSIVTCLNPFSCLESIYGHEYEYISLLAPEYEYIYLLGEVNMGPEMLHCRTYLFLYDW